MEFRIVFFFYNFVSLHLVRRSLQNEEEKKTETFK